VTYRLSFHLNALAPPVLEGGTARSTVGESRLFLRPLLPADARMSTSWQTLDGIDFVPRVDLQPAAPTASFDALTVLAAVGADVKAMPETRALRSEGGTMVGARILDPALEQVVLFGAAELDPVQGPVAYAVPAGRARHHLFGLRPGATYRVSASRSGEIRVAPAAGGFAADGAGALVFDVAGESVTALPSTP
jgi:hypothetical protein